MQARYEAAKKNSEDRQKDLDRAKAISEYCCNALPRKGTGGSDAMTDVALDPPKPDAAIAKARDAATTLQT
eukprot:2757702-Alexandrium_andersonii.AAC.1